MKVKIRTEKEFLEKFGEDWRKVVYKQFPTSMDKFLGKEIILDKKQEQEYKKRKFFWVNDGGEYKKRKFFWVNDGGEYMLSVDMIVDLSEKINKMMKL